MHRAVGSVSVCLCDYDFILRPESIVLFNSSKQSVLIEYSLIE